MCVHARAYWGGKTGVWVAVTVGVGEEANQMFWAEVRRRPGPGWMFLHAEGAWKRSEEGSVPRQLVGAAGTVGHSRQERRPCGLGERSEPSLIRNPRAVTQVPSDSLGKGCLPPGSEGSGGGGSNEERLNYPQLRLGQAGSNPKRAPIPGSQSGIMVIITTPSSLFTQ